MPARGNTAWQNAESRPGGLTNAEARAHGVLAWPFDPLMASTAGTQANTKLVGVFLSEKDVVAGIVVPVTVAGVTMTHAFVGIYDSALNLLVSSPDSPTAFQTTGWISVTFAAPFIVPADGLYYLASAFQGSTLPTVLNVAQNSALSVGQPANTVPRAVMAAVPAGALPNPATSAGAFANVPLLIAY